MAPKDRRATPTRNGVATSVAIDLPAAGKASSSHRPQKNNQDLRKISQPIFKRFSTKQIHPVTAGKRKNNFKFRFKPESGSFTRFGNEWDLCARYDFTDNYYASVTYARFNAKSGNTGFVGSETSSADSELGDVTKYWLTLGAKF